MLFFNCQAIKFWRNSFRSHKVKRSKFEMEKKYTKLYKKCKRGIYIKNYMKTIFKIPFKIFTEPYQFKTRFCYMEKSCSCKSEVNRSDDMCFFILCANKNFRLCFFFFNHTISLFINDAKIFIVINLLEAYMELR